MLSGTARDQIAGHDGGWKWKTIFRLIIIFLNILAVILIGVSVAKGGAQVGGLIVPIIASVAYNLVVVIVLMVRKKPIHPGINVACDLILWLAFLIGSLAELGFALLIARADELVDSNSSSVDNLSSDQEEALNKAASAGKIVIGGVVITFILAAMHFVIFVSACVDTHRYRHSTRPAHVVQPSVYNSGPQDYHMDGFPTHTAYSPVPGANAPPPPSYNYNYGAEQGYAHPGKPVETGGPGAGRYYYG